MSRVGWRRLKQAPLLAFKMLGGFERMLDSAWRRKRLLILCYHGVSIDDEHQWNPAMYVTADALRRRFEILRDARCAILPLQDALKRLYTTSLPPRSVAITFDDGYFDVYSRAYPLLRAFDVPATVYIATLRCENNRPVFNLMCSYLVWKARGRVIELEAIGEPLDLRTPAARAKAVQRIIAFASRERLGIEGKDALAAELAGACAVDYPDVVKRRLLSIMTPDEVRALSAQGVSFELHTHRHITPTAAAVWEREIGQNRESIERMTQRPATHFCYPSGIYRPEFLPWLTEQRVVSATTCDPGLASQHTNPLLLPRFVDTTAVSPVEFEGWVSGAATFVSRNRSYGDGAH
jgi:peptidoglycan/xylan/chitin deacetylase (PgdA/CDA1 family)